MEKYPEKEYTKTTFSFTQAEVINLKIAQTTQLTVLGTALRRVGKNNDSPDIGLEYNLEKGELYVYEPKFWCSACHSRKAQFSYNNNNYCPTCLEVFKTQALKDKTKIIKPEKKEIKK